MTLNLLKHLNDLLMLNNSLKYFLLINFLIQTCNFLEVSNNEDIGKNLEVIKEELKYSDQMKKNFDPVMYKYIKELNIIDDNYPPVTIEEKRNPVFVTPLSQIYTQKGIALIHSIQTFFPNSKIVVYDLGLRNNNVNQLKRVCNVIYKKFNFTNYPPHVSNLRTYAFKALVIAAALRDYKAIWYLDSSLTLTRSNLTYVYEAMESKKSSYFLHSSPNHGILRGTVKEMFDYLPSDRLKLLRQRVTMYQAGLAYVVRDKEAMRKVLKWYVLCSLTSSCITPKNSKKQCKGFRTNKYSGNFDRCHRQDQSIINVVLWNAYNGTISEYTSGYNNFYRIRRQQKGKWKSLRYCK